MEWPWAGNNDCQNREYFSEEMTCELKPTWCGGTALVHHGPWCAKQGTGQGWLVTEGPAVQETPEDYSESARQSCGWGWVEASQAVEEASRMEKGCKPICKLEQDEWDGLGCNPGEDDFRGKDSDSNMAKLVVSMCVQKEGYSVSPQSLEEILWRKSPWGWILAENKGLASNQSWESWSRHGAQLTQRLGHLK